MPSSSSSLTISSKSTVYPSVPAAPGSSLKLSVSDLPMLSCHYIQKGVLLSDPALLAFSEVVLLLKQALSLTLSHFPAFAGRLSTDPLGHVHILCNDAGADFIEAKAKHLTVRGVLSPDKDVPDCVKQFFAFDRTVSYNGHFLPLLAAARGSKRPSNSPDFSRENVFVSPSAILRLPAGGPAATFSQDEPLRERIFHFSRAAILKMKSVANGAGLSPAVAEIMGKQSNDGFKAGNGKIAPSPKSKAPTEISSFQSLCGQLWRSVTRARKLAPSKTTTFRMAVNCRHRLEPRLEPYYFGNAIQSIPTVASAGELLSHDLGWCSGLLHRNVVAHDDATVRRGVEGWESEPRLFPLGNFDGASITMGSSPRFPMYDNDFGWGRPLAVRSGRANKFDGKISAFPGREGGGSVDLEVVLAPETIVGLENDAEFMQYVSSIE
ncbi:uncharacterized protein J3R85_000472 [Psidium guajava]|nr:uncharacterized protein J3R85_000472 [Psidium guajava]